MLAVMSASPSPSPRTPHRSRPRSNQPASDDLWDMPTTGTPASSSSSARKNHNSNKKGTVTKRSSNLALSKHQLGSTESLSSSPLTWQQQALASSPAPATPTPSKKTSGKKNNKHPLSVVSSSAPSSTTDLTWQQALFPEPSPSPAPSLAPSNSQASNSAPSKKSKKKAAAQAAAAEKSYAGPLFHQSPSAQSLPAPKFKPAASSGLRHESPESTPATASVPALTSDTSSSNSSGELAPASSPITIPAQSNSMLPQSSPLDSPTPAAPRPQAPQASTMVESHSAPVPVPVAPGGMYAPMAQPAAPTAPPAAPHMQFMPQVHSPGPFHLPHPHFHWPHMHHQSTGPPPAVPSPESHSRTLSLAALFPNHSFEHRTPQASAPITAQAQTPVQSAPIQALTPTSKPAPATNGTQPQTIETLLAKLMV